MSFAPQSRHGGLCLMTPGDDRARSPRRGGVGRRSQLVLFSHWIEQWLVEDPDLSSAEILKRIRRSGYRGGKSALYELVRRLRALRRSARSPSTQSNRDPPT